MSHKKTMLLIRALLIILEHQKQPKCSTIGLVKLIICPPQTTKQNFKMLQKCIHVP